MIMPAVMTIMTKKAGPHRMGRVMGVLGVPMLIAPILGPILGGWLVDNVSWRWIFFINLPIGIVAFILALIVLERDQPQPAHRLDWLGMLLLSPGLAVFIFGLAESSTYGFGSLRSWGPTARGRRADRRVVRPQLAQPEPADRPADVRPHARRRGRGHVPAVRDLGVRDDAARSPLLPVGPRRVGAPGRPAAGAGRLRRDADDAARGPPDRPLRAHLAARHRPAARRDRADPVRVRRRRTPPTFCCASATSSRASGWACR